MNIGLDAKRAFHNNTGLGNYSRTLIKGLAEYYPQHYYFLLNPKEGSAFPDLPGSGATEVLPSGITSRLFSSAWRSSWVKGDLKRLGIHLYHGLSHEIPAGMEKTGIPSVVTIHDLIFERYPEQFKKMDRLIYRKKFRNACTHSDRIIAISAQTARDVTDLYGISRDKIDVCYQACDEAFARPVPETEKERVRQFYKLPGRFFLSVGSIIERKNLLGICTALRQLNGEAAIPLVVIGSGKEYKRKVQDYVTQQGLTSKVLFLSDTPEAKRSGDYRNGADLPAIYASATALVYPSFFEGFGIPVLEALWSGLPVVTSNTSCLPETGGNGVLYADPARPEEIAAAMQRVVLEEGLADTLRVKGRMQAETFHPKACTDRVMNVYQKLTT